MTARCESPFLSSKRAREKEERANRLLNPIDTPSPLSLSLSLKTLEGQRARQGETKSERKRERERKEWIVS